MRHLLYYIDGRILEEEQSYDNPATPRPSPTEPEKMQEPIPIGLMIPSDSEFSHNYTIAGDIDIVGIGCTSPNVELAAEFILYILP